MCIDVHGGLDRGMPHELLRRSDVDSFSGEVCTVFVSETIRNEILCERIRRHQLVPVGPASHLKIELPAEGVP